MSRAGEVWELQLLPQGTCVVVLLGPTERDKVDRELPIALTIWSEFDAIPAGDVGAWDPVYFVSHHSARRIA